MNQRIKINRLYNTRLTIIDEKRLSLHSFKKSKTRINQKKNKKNSKEMKHVSIKNFSKGNIPVMENDSVNVQDIFEDIVGRIQNKNKEMNKKIEFDKKGSLKIVDMNKETDPVSNISKLDLISGSLVNNYWPGESLYTKEVLSKYDDQIHSLNEPKKESTGENMINEKLKKTSKRARELVNIIFRKNNHN
jgi:hypothetical protein